MYLFFLGTQLVVKRAAALKPVYTWNWRVCTMQCILCCL